MQPHTVLITPRRDTTRTPRGLSAWRRFIGLCPCQTPRQQPANGCRRAKTARVWQKRRQRLVVVCLVILWASRGAESAERSRTGKAPPVDENFICAGCIAAVRSTVAMLGHKVIDEEEVQDLLSDGKRMCHAGLFEDRDPGSTWRLPPPETARACHTFLARFGEGAVGDMIVTSKSTNLETILDTVCNIRTSACAKDGTPVAASATRSLSPEGQHMQNKRLLWAAASAGSSLEVSRALSDGAEIDAIADNEGGRSALMAACLAGKHKTVKTLLAAGADWRVGEKDGYTCMHGAGFQGHAKVVATALAAGVPVRGNPHEDGFLPIHRACWGDSKGHADTVRVMVLEGKEDVDARTADRQTPLLLVAAARKINLHLVKRLISLGADLSVADARGETALHKLFQGGMLDHSRSEAVALLVKAGLDLSAKGSEEGDLKHLAWQFGYEEVVDRALAEKHARSKPLPTNLHLQHEAEAAARNAAMAAAAAAAGAGVADVKFDL